MNYLEEYKKWCTEGIFDEETKKELKKIENDEKEIKDRFYKSLEFGTAGLRGVMGAGTNRMNKYTVTKATQGLANFIIKEKAQEKGVAIAYDSRNMSKEFSEYAALCLNANGIKTYIFETLRPVPELSFAVRKLNCISGIMITASHNPPKYNGYKVYWEDGAQITAPKDKEIIEEVKKVEDYSEIKKISKEIKEKEEIFKELGFNFEEFGINTVIIKSHPTWLKSNYEGDNLKYIVDLVIDSSKNFNKDRFLDSLAKMVSCKMSVKANEHLSMIEMEKLLDDLVKCDNPYNCCHGRPSIMKFTNYELEKMFRRVL